LPTAFCYFSLAVVNLAYCANANNM